MGKNNNAFLKKQRADNKRKKRADKEEKKKERRLMTGPSDTWENMVAYVDSEGNIVPGKAPAVSEEKEEA